MPELAAALPSFAPAPVDEVLGEATRLARFYALDLDPIERVLDAMRPHLSTYAELSLTETGFELTTGGFAPAAFADLARREGGATAVVEAYRAAVAEFPTRMSGVKIAFGPKAAGPSLYVRTLCEKQRVFGLLSRSSTFAAAVPSLAAATQRSHTAYALGFYTTERAANAPRGKLYTIDDVSEALLDPEAGGATSSTQAGFVTHRFDGSGVTRDRKDYLVAVPWERIVPASPRWREIIAFARDILGFPAASYFGRAENGELKLYAERIGAIPSDLSAR